VQTVDDRAVQVWHAAAGFSDPPDAEVLRAEVARALAGGLDIPARLAARAAETRSRLGRHAEPRAEVLPGASSEAAVLEVRAHDTPGLLYRLVAAIGASDAVVRSAVVGTLGAEAVDVFYLVDADGKALPDEAMDDVVRAVTAAVASE
ncbi:MAG: ACT domain-containing protein, partial [Acidimicrobiales bacterium]